MCSEAHLVGLLFRPICAATKLHIVRFVIGKNLLEMQFPESTNWYCERSTPGAAFKFTPKPVLDNLVIARRSSDASIFLSVLIEESAADEVGGGAVVLLLFSPVVVDARLVVDSGVVVDSCVVVGDDVELASEEVNAREELEEEGCELRTVEEAAVVEEEEFELSTLPLTTVLCCCFCSTSRMWCVLRRSVRLPVALWPVAFDKLPASCVEVTFELSFI